LLRVALSLAVVMPSVSGLRSSSVSPLKSPFRWVLLSVMMSEPRLT
jgi:hypothetical protein